MVLNHANKRWLVPQKSTLTLSLVFNTMENCPFCDAEVSEELIRFGGACPTCFNAIPGEEAPTDPGLTTDPEVVQQGGSSQKLGSNLVPAVLAAMLFVAFALFLFGNMESESEVGLMESAEDRTADVSAVEAREENNRAVAESQALAAADETERLAEEARVIEEAAQVETTRAAEAAEAAVAASEATEQQEVYVDRVPSVGFITEASPDDSYRDPATYIARNEPDVVTGASAIRRAIRGVISDNSGAADFCYSQQNDRDLGGTWSVSFVVNEDGSTSEINVAAQDLSHEGLERCLRGKITRWLFPAIAEATPYSKDYNFTPAF
jgi:hypothetical protein